MTPVETIRAAAEARGLDPRRHGRGYRMLCPVHEDRQPSLDVDEGDDGCALLKCRAGCDTTAVVGALGLTMRDLFHGANSHGPTRPAPRNRTRPDPLPSEKALSHWRQQLASSEAALARLKELRGWTPQALADLGIGFDGERLTIPVHGPGGELVNLLRYRPNAPGPQKMRSLKGRRRDLFPAPESLSPDAERVWLVEGEPDAIAMASLGLPAVAVPGAEGWRDEWAPRFASRRVIVCCDSDQAGRKVAQRAAAALAEHAQETRVVDLAPGRDDGYDVGDLVAETKSADNRAELVEMLAIIAAGAEGVAADAPSVPAPGGAGRRLILTPASKITPEPVRWLWNDRLPLRGLSLIAGEPGLGKSTLTIDLAARVSRGELQGGLQGRAHDVLIATAEDHWASVVVGRLRAAGADLERVHRVTVQERDIEAQLTLPDDVAAIEGALDGLAAQGRPVGFVVVDPVGAYIASAIDTHRDAAVRRVLVPLAALAERHRLSVTGVAHLNKSDASKLLTRVGGSVAFGAAPRSVLVFARHPEDAAGELGSERVIVHAKSNQGSYAPTLAARIDGSEVEGIGSVSRLVVLGECDVGPEDLARTGDQDRSDRASAAEWLEDELADGAWHEVREVKAAAKVAGIAERTLQRARRQLGIEVHREGFPAVGRWRLPVVPPPPGSIGTTGSGTTENTPLNTDDLAPPRAQSCHIPESGTTGTNSAPEEPTDDLDDLGPERPLHNPAAEALRAASCACERPLPAPDDGQLRCARCGRSLDDWVGAAA